MLKFVARIHTKTLISCLTKPVTLNNGRVTNVLLQHNQFTRNTSFFTKLTADELWKGVTSVSNAGKKRGRGKGTDKKGKKNLNLGQKVGVGKANIVWPGLTSPVIRSGTVLNIQQLPKDHTENEPSPTSKKKKSYKLHPLERGWSGKKVVGRYFGPPNSNEEENYDDFDSVVIENNLVATMTSIMGRKRRYSVAVLTGNGKGLIGMGLGCALEWKNGIKKAQNKAIKHLLSFSFVEPHTINHDFFSQFGKTKVFVYKKPTGYGLKCHRVIKECCRLIGIKNIAAKVEGSTNVRHIVKAFLMGLLRQKTYQQIADENKLHLVEYRNERLNFPEVVASPEVCVTQEKASSKPFRFEDYIWNGKVVYKRPKKVPFYVKHPGWQTHLKQTAFKRNHSKVKSELIHHQGEFKSFLEDVYECVPWKQKFKKQAVQESQ